jgi:GxxExxY protein
MLKPHGINPEPRGYLIEDWQEEYGSLENNLSSTLIGAAIRVLKALGPGLLESAYEECLHYDLVESGLYVQRQQALPIVYKEVKMEMGYRVDLLVEKMVIVEIKSVENLNDVHLAQVLTYLKLSDKKLGLLIHFNTNRLVTVLKRIVNKL